MNWAVFLGAFAGSLIELVEILAVVLVVGNVAGWRNALVGAGSAIGLVVVVALIVGKGLTLIPLHALEIFAGVILWAYVSLVDRFSPRSNAFCHCTPLVVCRAAVSQGRVKSLPVVEHFDKLEYRTPHLFSGGPGPSVQ